MRTESNNSVLAHRISAIPCTKQMRTKSNYYILVHRIAALLAQESADKVRWLRFCAPYLRSSCTKKHVVMPLMQKKVWTKSNKCVLAHRIAAIRCTKKCGQSRIATFLSTVSLLCLHKKVRTNSDNCVLVYRTSALLVQKSAEKMEWLHTCTPWSHHSCTKKCGWMHSYIQYRRWFWNFTNEFSTFSRSRCVFTWWESIIDALPKH